jgi:hypothetical protein
VRHAILNASREAEQGGADMPRAAPPLTARRPSPPAEAGRGRLWFIVAVVTVTAAAAVAWALWPRPAAQARTRQYLDATACLLTSPSGIVRGTAAASVWTALQSASLSTHVMVSYVPAAIAADVPAILNSLIERRCGVIVATGADSAAVTRTAWTHPRQRFLLITGSGARAPANLTLVKPAAARGGIGQALQALAAHATPLPS